MVRGDPAYPRELLADDDVFRNMLEAFDIVRVATFSSDLDDGLDGLFTLFGFEIKFSGVLVEGLDIDISDEEASTAVVVTESEGVVVVDWGIGFNPPDVIEKDELVYDLLGSFTSLEHRIGDGDRTEGFDIFFGLEESLVFDVDIGDLESDAPFDFGFYDSFSVHKESRDCGTLGIPYRAVKLSLVFPDGSIDETEFAFIGVTEVFCGFGVFVDGSVVTDDVDLLELLFIELAAVKFEGSCEDLVEVTAVTVRATEDTDERVFGFELEKFHIDSLLVVYNQDSRAGEARPVLGSCITYSGCRLC